MSDETQEPWNLIQNGNNRIVSPEVTNRRESPNQVTRELTNQFEALTLQDEGDGTDSETISDDTASEQGTESTEELETIFTHADYPRYTIVDPEPPVRTSIITGTTTTPDEEESNDDSIDTIMSTHKDVSNLPNLLKAMEELIVGSTTPIQKDRNYAQVVRFRETMGSTLAQFPCARYDCGYAWLVDTAEKYQERLGDSTATRPTAPKQPTEPVPDPTTGKIAKSALFKYTGDLREYKNCSHWTKEALRAIEVKFPTSLNSKKNRLGGFAISLTSQTAMDHVMESVNKPIARRTAHCAFTLSINT
jgi:hypothetical protein